MSGNINCICCQTNDSNVLLGDLLKKGPVTVHQNCLYSCSGLSSKGGGVGIGGVPISQLVRYCRSRKENVCHFCYEDHAVIRCSRRSCKKNFHYICLVESGGLTTFAKNGAYSFCSEHKRPVKSLPASITKSSHNCTICLDEIDFSDNDAIIRAPCCRRRCIMHKLCVMLYASNAGSDVKCPACNNKTQFRKAIRDRGVCIPDWTATWEDPLEIAIMITQTCNAVNCLAPSRYFNDPRVDPHIWCGLNCARCNAIPVHLGCLNREAGPYMCPSCIDNVYKINSAMIVNDTNDANGANGTNDMDDGNVAGPSIGN